MRSSFVMLALSALVAAPAAALLGCSSARQAQSAEQDEAPLVVYGSREDDAGHPPPGTTRTHHVRLHGGAVIDAMHVQVIYVGKLEEIGTAPARDDVVSWTLTSGSAYWNLLAQYGVGRGALDGSRHVAREAILSPTVAEGGGIVTAEDLEAAIHAFLHPASGAASVPKANAYVFFLPDGVNVSFGARGAKTMTSCIDVGGYHRHDGDEPYAVLPPCELGRSARAISEELAEMATDPVVGTGWVSDDEGHGGDEIADLCDAPVTLPLRGLFPTQLWSNADAACLPE